MLCESLPPRPAGRLHAQEASHTLGSGWPKASPSTTTREGHRHPVRERKRAGARPHSGQVSRNRGQIKSDSAVKCVGFRSEAHLHRRPWSAAATASPTRPVAALQRLHDPSAYRAAVESPHGNGLASQACKAPWDAYPLQKKAPTASRVQVPSNSRLPFAARRGRPGPCRGAPEWESSPRVNYCEGEFFSSSCSPAPRAAQHGLSEREGPCGLASYRIRALRSRVAPPPDGKGHRHRLKRRPGGLHDPRCAAPEALGHALADKPRTGGLDHLCADQVRTARPDMGCTHGRPIWTFQRQLRSF